MGMIKIVRFGWLPIVDMFGFFPYTYLVNS